MVKKKTYPKVLSCHWLLAVSFSVSILLFTGFFSISEAYEPLPEQIEQVRLNHENLVNNIVSYQEIILRQLSNVPLKKTREYKSCLRLHQQRSTHIHIATVTERTYTFISPVYFQFLATIQLSLETRSSFV